jgi:hypothetical protein
MRRTIRLIFGLVSFIGIQAVSVIVLAAEWRAQADIPGEGTLFAFLGLHFISVMVACAAAALIWYGAGPEGRPAGGPPSPPPPFAPTAVAVGPRTPAPLGARVATAETRAA